MNSGHDQGANSVCMRIPWQITFSKICESQFVNQNLKILGRRLYSPSLKDVALLEVAEVTFSNFQYIRL